MKTIISMVVPTVGTVVRYDQWEDGYEADLNAPVQSTTLIWGDGNTSNGTAPGYPTDLFPAGATVNLTNNVALPRAAATLFYDGRDRIGCTAAIAVTRAGWGVAPGTVLASATEVYDTRRYGTSYKIPVGITTGSVQNFEYSSLHMISGADNNTVQVDVDGNGTVDQTKVINLGESMLVNGGVKAGATVTSSKPVQVHQLTGDVGSTYESRTFAIRPTSLWGSSYFAPVGTTLATEVHTIFFYNPNASAINVTYQTTTGTGTISVPANSNSQFAMPMNSGAQFSTVSGETFYAVGANDSGAAATANQTHDWGYALVPESYLTTGVVIGFGPGSDDLNAPTGPDQNGSPVWITPATSTTIYVNYSGDLTIGANTAPNGAKYDVSYNVNKLQSQTIYDTNDKDMTKARIFTTDGAKLAAAWGEDPSKAGPGAPFLDMGTTIVPFPQPSLSKTSALVVDLNSDGKTGVGDTIEYSVRVANEGVVDLDNTIVLDALPNTCTYVANSTKVNGVTITDNTSPASIFPVDESGYTLFSIPPGGFTLVKYRVTVNPGAASVINNATANGGQAVLTATTTSPIVPAGGNAPTTITFSNSVGTATTSYPQNGNVYVKVTNADLNTNFAVVETITVTVTNPTTGDQELITLTETGPSTGIFLNTTALPSSITGGLTQQDNTLYALQGNGLVATFVNTLFGGTFTANAVIETSTLTKKLYLTDTLAMDRVNPAAAPLDTTTAQSSPLGSGASTIAMDPVSTNQATNSNTITVTHTTGSGANRLMLVGISKEDDLGSATYSVTSVTYGSQSLTKVIERVQAEAECEIWMLANPASGTNTVTVNFTGAETIDSAVVGVATFSGVNQSTPLRTSGANSANGTNASITIASAVNDLVFDVLALDDARAPTITAGQTSRWSLIEGTASSNGIRAAASTKPGASSVTSGWTVSSDDWAMCAVSIQPAIVSSTVSFTQVPTFATAFTMPAGAAPSASVHYTVASGSMPASPAITAVLKKGATTIATSSSASASGGLLSFTFPALASNASFAIGEAATLEITSAQSGVTFTIDYDSDTKPSVVNLPTNTVIVINNFGLYDAPFPGGTLITSMTNGQRVYARVKASDPFGAYDITGLDLAIIDPSNSTNTVNLTSTVASDASSKTYEYSWLAGPNDGGYTIQATAKEGSEGITAISSLPLQVASLDLGTPSTTTFTDATGNTVPSYTTSGPVYVQVVDRDQNINTTVAETVTVVVTSSNGDLETITLTETGVNTGIFRSSAITTNTSAVTQGNSVLNVVPGATLAANYVDPTDPADTSSASALITSPTSNALSIVKTRIIPADGSALPGDPVQFEITVTNAGNNNRSNVTVTDSFPSANLTYVSATPASGGSTSVAPTFTRTWNLGTLTPGQSSTIVVNFTAGAASSSLVTNTASVSSNNGNTTAGPSTASLQIGAPGVTVTKSLLTPSAGPVYIGDTIVWRIVVQNTGSTSLTTVPLSDNYSGGALTYVSATVAPDSTGSGSLLWNNIGPIAAAASRIIDVTMTVKGTSNPTTNTADVSYAIDALGNSVPPSVSSASVQTIGGSIGTTIFKDMNNNGVFDSNEGIQNVYVYSDTNGDGIRQATEPFGITDFYGAYSIYNLPVALAGTTYNVKVDTTTLPAGLTTVVVDPDATKNGQTSITLTRAALDNITANFGYRGTASVSDTVWVDVNADGLLDATDRRLSGVKVFIDQNNNGTADTNEPFAITNASGNYLIPNLPDATWTVAIDTTTLPAGVTPTYDLNGIGTPHKTSVVLTPGQARTDVDFGYIGSASIATNIYNDLNGDGTKAVTDLGLAGVRVFLDLNANGSRDANEQFATTDSSGNYLISGLIAGTYTVVVDATSLPAGVTVTGDPDVTKDGRTTVTLTSAQALTTANFGYQGNASIGDRVWNDLNGDGVQDATDLSISGVRVFIDLNANGTRDANEPFATTNASGAYTITGLIPGIYTVAVDPTSLPSGTTTTGDPDETKDGKTSVTLAAGVPNTTSDFGYQGNGAISAVVFLDRDASATQTTGEPGISGVTVFLDYNGDGIRQTNEPQTTTSSTGAYSFTGLIPGNYSVVVVSATLPVGVTQTADADATKDNKTTVTVTAGAANTTPNFGYQGNASIGNYVWIDADGNGAQGSTEIPLGGVVVYLDLNSNGTRESNEPFATTNASGIYALTGLPAGTYSVAVDTTSLPAGVTNTGDPDATKDGKTSVTLAAAQNLTTANFGYQGNATVTGHLYIDTNGNRSQDSGEPDLANVDVLITDSLGNAQTVATNSSGDWSANVIPGSISANIDETDPQYPTGYTQTQGTDPTAVTAIAGSNTNAGIDGYAPPVDLGIVKSVNNPTPLVGSDVVFTLVVTNHGVGPATGVRVSDALPTGYEFVSANPPAGYVSATGIWTIGSLAKDATATLTITAKVKSSGNFLNVATVSVDQDDPNPGNNTDDASTTPIQLGAITGAVLEDTDNNGTGDTAIQGVILSLVDGSGSPVLDGSGQPRTTTSDSNGSYSFASLPPGTYGVIEMQPGGFASLSDKDAGNLDEIRPIIVITGETNTLNDFVEISRCPETWADWKQLHPGETAAGNPDADAYDNFAEFAFAMPYDAGTGSPWLGSTAWVIQPSTLAPGTIEAVFVRPKGAPQNVTYTLQYAAVLGNPIVLQSIAIQPLIGVTILDNGDCTETVTIHDLEGVTGLTTGTGIVRIKAELDEVPTTGTDHTSYSEVEGWKETPLELCCRTYNNPYLRETSFTGTVSGVSGQNMTFAVSAGSMNLSNLFTSGGAFYLEVISGDHEGNRFDIVSASGNAVTLASDSNLYASTAPFNTLVGSLPASLVGDQIAIKRHWTLAETFPPTAFGANGSQSFADQVQVFSGGAWTIYWLFDLNPSDLIPARWVDAADGNMTDQGGTVIPPGQGVFFNNRTSVTSILAYGEIRKNKFIRPLAVGSNLVGGGYPMVQSPNGNVGINPLDVVGRAMNTGTGFLGSRDFKTADSIFVWKGDTTANAQGYDTYFLLDGAPTLPSLLRWVKVGDSSLARRDGSGVLLGNRSTFVRAASEVPQHTTPSPWTP